MLTLKGLRLILMNATAPTSSTDHPSDRRRRVSNRVLLAPLAGIGNWFVRLQANGTAPASRSRRWSPASPSTTATSAPCAS